ncbi:MAG: Gmad2 immunoglobulin-like domain-containing protein [Acidobacteriaceae bacterium]
MEKQSVSYYIKVLGLAIVAAAAIYLIPGKVQSPTTSSTQQPSNTAVTDFATCAAAGNQVYQGTPEICQAADGTLYINENSLGNTTTQQADVVVDSPKEGDLVKSPLTITGKAKGNWFFEAVMPVTLKDQNGKVLAKTQLRAQGDWMTSDYVNFTGELKFAQPSTDYGVIIIEPDNPSGQQDDRSASVSVRFK